MNVLRGMTILIVALASAAPAAAQSPHDLFQQALRKDRTEGDLPGAIVLYSQVVEGQDRSLAARALVRIGESLERLGRADARAAYERVVRDFPDQAEPVRLARARIAAFADASGDRMSPAPLGEADLRLRLVWEDPGVDVEGQPTSAGRYLTFVDWESGDLALRDLRDGTHRLLTRTGYPQYALQSAVSNDDRRVAYFWTSGGEGEWRPELRVIGLDGTGERTLVFNENEEIEYLAPYAWTSDDRKILAVITRAGSWDVTLVDAANGTEQVIRSLTNGTSSRLTLSPDDRWIAYDQAVDRMDMDGDREIHLLAADGSRSMQVTHHPATDLHPLFTPDGRHLLFTSNRGGSVDLWGVRVGEDGPEGEPTLVKRDIGSGAFLMGFTADGSLFYARDTGGGDVYAAPFDPATLRVTGEPERRVQVFEGYNSGPGWSPDGGRIAYTSRRNTVTVGQGASLFIRDAHTGREIETTGHARFHRKWTRPVFSPDGRTLISDAGSAGDAVLLAVDAETGAERVLTRARGATVVGWSPDGQAAWYVAFTPEEFDADDWSSWLFRYDLAEDRAIPVLELGRDWVRYTGRISPDGRSFAWIAGPETATVLRVASLEGGSIRDVYRPAAPVAISQSASVAWTPDARHVLFAVSEDEGWVANKTREVVAIPMAGGEPARVGLAAHELRHLSVLADGSALGYAAGPQGHAEVWVLENLLPVLGGR